MAQQSGHGISPGSGGPSPAGKTGGGGATDPGTPAAGATAPGATDPGARAAGATEPGTAYAGAPVGSGRDVGIEVRLGRGALDGWPRAGSISGVLGCSWLWAAVANTAKVSTQCSCRIGPPSVNGGRRRAGKKGNLPRTAVPRCNEMWRGEG